MHCPRALAVAGSRFLERHASARTQDRFLDILAGFEQLEHWPTRYLSGHFIAIRALKPGPEPAEDAGNPADNRRMNQP